MRVGGRDCDGSYSGATCLQMEVAPPITEAESRNAPVVAVTRYSRAGMISSEQGKPIRLPVVSSALHPSRGRTTPMLLRDMTRGRFFVVVKTTTGRSRN
jgi:hypothetical protein